MDQLAAMLARTAMPSGIPTAGSPSTSTEALSSAPPLPSGGTDNVPNREVCNLKYLTLASSGLVNVCLSQWDVIAWSY